MPPLLNGRVVIEGDDPSALAIEGAATGTLGAGDVLWLQDATRVELAIVLEPDVALTKSIVMLPLGLAAVGDSLGALTPPQVGIQYRWPATILLNGASAGACTLTAPRDCARDAVPAWMVLSFSLRLAFPGTAEPGTNPGITSLAEEGGEELTTIDVIESFSRHFLSLLDTWTNDGFAAIADNWRGRLEGLDSPISIAHPGKQIKARALGLDEDGNLLIKPESGGRTISLPLIDCIARATPPVANLSTKPT